MTKRLAAVLEKIFAAEIAGRLPCQLRDSKALRELIEDGCVIAVEGTLGGGLPVKVKGYALTFRGNYQFCTWAAGIAMNWIDELADKIRSEWIEWEADASMQSTVEQDSQAGEFYLHGKLVEAIERAYAKSSDSKEQDRRVYYQNIVYAVCNQLDRAFCKRVNRGEGTVCGTVDDPTTQVQDLMKELVDRDAARSAKEAAEQHGEIPVLEGRRCPKCQSLMLRGGYRCPRGCQ